MLETGIVKALLGHGPTNAVVSGRVKPLGLAPNTPRPYLTYQVTSRATDGNLDGTITDYRKAEFDIGVYADTYSGVMSLSDLVRNRLDQFGGTVGGVEFAPAIFDTETDIDEAVPEGQAMPIYLRVMTFRCLYKISG